MTRGRLFRVVSRVARRERGQMLVEFAIAFPIFLVLLFALLDTGRYVYMTVVLSQAAREGARVAVVEAKWIGSSDVMCLKPGDDPVVYPGRHRCPADADALHDDVTAAVNRMAAPFGPIPGSSVYMSCDPSTPPVDPQWTIESCDSPTTGSVASIRVVLTFQPLTPVVSTIVGPIKVMSTVTSGGSSSMTIY
jgi:general stress protein CsbA